MRILYIDDADEERESLASELRERGLEVVTSSSGPSGLDVLRNGGIDVTLCDLNMPEMDGIDVLLAATDLAPDTPFILLTSHPTVSRAHEAIKHGAYRFLIKPVRVDEIEITVQLAIEHARLQRWKDETEEQLRHIVEMTPVPMLMSRLSDGRILYANRHFAKLLATDIDRLRGRSTKEFYAVPEERAAIVEGDREGRPRRQCRDEGDSRGWSGDLDSLLPRHGRTSAARMSSSAVSTTSPAAKRSEDRLRVFRAIFDQSIDVIVVWDANNRVVSRNPSHERRTGFSDEEFIGKDASELSRERKPFEKIRETPGGTRTLSR